MGACTRRISRPASWASGSIALAVLATWATGAGLISSQPFSVPMGNPPIPVWSGPPETRTGVTVKVTAGSGAARVEATGTPANLGQVAPGNSYVVEGNWSELRVARVAGATAGIVERRFPTLDYPGSDGAVGVGTITLPPQGASVGAYANFATPAAYRLFTVKAAGTEPIVVRSAAGGPTLLTLGAGDWSFVGLAAAPEFRVEGKGLVEFMVYDLRPGVAPCVGTSSGNAGELDRVSVDGTKNLAVTLTTTACPLTVNWQILGQAPTNTPLSAGQSYTFSGNLVVLQWSYGSPGQVSIQVTAGS